MQILLNGESQEIKEEITLDDLVGSYSGIAVAINENVIPQENWGKWKIQQNDRVEVIAPFQGG